MNRLWSAVLLGVVVAAGAQPPVAPSSPDATVMLAAVSRDESMLTGGIGPSKWTGKGTVAVEPLAHLTASGEWSGLACSSSANDTSTGQRNCLEFAHEYLSRPHVYTVISADGNGAVVHAAPTTLDECYGYRGAGTYSGATIRKSAIAASSAEFFAESALPRVLPQREGVAVRKALSAFVPKGLDTTEKLRIVAVRLEGQDMVVVQRVFADIANMPERYKLVFAVGTMGGGQLHILHWKQNSVDEEEALLGTIRLKNGGREFLVTAVSDPESHFFRVYGIRAGRLIPIYTGGGFSC